MLWTLVQYLPQQIIGSGVHCLVLLFNLLSVDCCCSTFHWLCQYSRLLGCFPCHWQCITYSWSSPLISSLTECTTYRIWHSNRQLTSNPLQPMLAVMEAAILKKTDWSHDRQNYLSIILVKHVNNTNRPKICIKAVINCKNTLLRTLAIARLGRYMWRHRGFPDRENPSGVGREPPP